MVSPPSSLTTYCPYLSSITFPHQTSNPQLTPPRSSLHTASQIISQNLSSVDHLLSTNAPLLSSVIAHPLPTYPGREQELVLHTLLRKKLEPHVEDWVESGRIAGVEATKREEGLEGIMGLWEWAGMAANEEARKHDWDEAEFTLEEREGKGGVDGVVTGLRGRMGEESEDEEDGESGEGKGKEKEKEKVKGNPMRMEGVLRFMAKGEEVKNEAVKK